MPDLDFFTLWRFMLSVAVTVYATVVLAQTAYSYVVWLSPEDRYTSLLRRYLFVHTLRVRARHFAADLALCALLTLALILLLVLHYLGVKGHL